MDKIELEIVALSHSISASASYAVVLKEKAGRRRLPVMIGSSEAQAIAVALEKMKSARPGTHDLLKNVMTEYEINCSHIVIDNLLEGVFYAKLVCAKDGGFIEIDSRTSDALAIAVRIGCPIYTYEFILEQAGIILEDEVESDSAEFSSEELQELTEIEKATAPSSLTEMEMSDLQSKLKEMVSKEDYEGAAKYRDEINKRLNS